VVSVGWLVVGCEFWGTREFDPPPPYTPLGSLSRVDGRGSRTASCGSVLLL